MQTQMATNVKNLSLITAKFIGEKIMILSQVRLNQAKTMPILDSDEPKCAAESPPILTSESTNFNDLSTW